ncbi:MAG: thiamine pyrophosphate-binding protein [bacterium]|nr:thiamine pyrophosphate-binding protein [bacterium]
MAQKRAAANQGLGGQARTEATIVETFADQLAALGVEQAFGVSGGAIALIFDALEESSIELRHFRHESGAAFAATEAHFATGKATVVFATTGPGLLNSLTGMTAARWDGAKVILVSGATNSPQRGRWATQETSSYTMPQDVFYTAGPIFDFAVRMEHASELPEVMRRLSLGLLRPGGFVAHVCMPMSVQSNRIDVSRSQPRVAMEAPTVSADKIAECACNLRSEPFAIWAGFGATEAALQVRELAERTGAPVFCSPRAKGVMPEDHPLYLGVTGLGGHDSVTQYMVQRQPYWVLVLGTRLGEATSFWDSDMLPRGGFLHVDIDPGVPGTAYPEANTFGIQADIGQFLDDLLQHFPAGEADNVKAPGPGPDWEEPVPIRLAGRGPVRPQTLMQVIQRRVIDDSDALVMSECGNSFAWCNHLLRFPTPRRYRVSTLFGSMGHSAAGVVGAAVAANRKSVAVVGDGSMLMNSEISSAVQYRAKAVWIVLNDSGYGMCRDGHRALGLTDANVDFQCVDFVGLARSQGADGVLVESEEMLDDALEQALAAEGPFVVDVRIDTTQASPLLRRFESLINQGNSKNVAGWEK